MPASAALRKARREAGLCECGIERDREDRLFCRGCRTKKYRGRDAERAAEPPPARRIYDFIMTATRESGFEGARLRLFAQTLRDHPSGHYKVVVQAFSPNGRPIAEDPISVEWMDEDQLSAYIETTRHQGWLVEESSLHAAAMLRQKAS